MKTIGRFEIYNQIKVLPAYSFIIAFKKIKQAIREEYLNYFCITPFGANRFFLVGAKTEGLENHLTSVFEIGICDLLSEILHVIEPHSVDIKIAILTEIASQNVMNGKEFSERLFFIDQPFQRNLMIGHREIFGNHKGLVEIEGSNQMGNDGLHIHREVEVLTSFVGIFKNVFRKVHLSHPLGYEQIIDRLVSQCKGSIDQKSIDSKTFGFRRFAMKS